MYTGKAESANGQDALGIGWVVEPAALPDGYGDTNLHLFAFARVVVLLEV